MRALLTAAAGLFAGLAALSFAGTAAADDDRRDRYRDRGDYYDDDRGRDYDRRRDRDYYRDRDRYRDNDRRRYRGGNYGDRRSSRYRQPYCPYGSY